MHYIISSIRLDIDIGGILNVIAENVKRNASLIQNNVQVVELDFKAQKFSDTLELIISDIEIVICADGKIINIFTEKLKLTIESIYFSYL